MNRNFMRDLFQRQYYDVDDTLHVPPQYIAQEQEDIIRLRTMINNVTYDLHVTANSLVKFSISLVSLMYLAFICTES